MPCSNRNGFEPGNSIGLAIQNPWPVTLFNSFCPKAWSINTPVFPFRESSSVTSINAFNISQFENHIRAVCDLKKEEVKKISNAEMQNILGKEIVEFRNKSFRKNQFFFDYEKKKIKDKRKMGHVTNLKN